MRVEEVRVPLGQAQVQGLSEELLGTGPSRLVHELWVNEDEPRAGAALRSVAHDMAVHESEEGVVRADPRLGVAGTRLLALPKEEWIAYSSAGELRRQLDNGWNESLDLLQVYPGSVPDVARSKHPLGVLVAAAPFFLACAHDGEALQVVPLAESGEMVSARIDAALARLGIEPIQREG